MAADKAVPWKKGARTKEQVSSILGRHSRELMDEINSEIAFSAKKISENLLTAVFRSIFRVERSCEADEPSIFQIGDDTDLILFNRLNAVQLQKLPFYIMNEEVLIRSFQLTTDIEFILMVDLSLSMLYRWPLFHLAYTGEYVSLQGINDIKEKCRQSKLYALKYLCYAFLTSALQNNFNVKIIFFSNGIDHEVSSGRDRQFPPFALNYMDDHYLRLYERISGQPNYSEVGGYTNMAFKALHRRKRCSIFILSDFQDGIEEIKPYLADINYRHYLILGLIEDPFEIEFPSRQPLTPITVTREHCKNLEENLGEELRLTSNVIRNYNTKARQRRKDMLNFFDHENIKYLDINTQHNNQIPGRIEELNLQLLYGE